MDRRLVLNAHLAVARGHRVDVMEAVDEESGRASVLQIVDLDSGVRYVRDEGTRGDIVRWSGRVSDCTVTVGSDARTVLTIDVEGGGAGETNARAALLGADAAVEAAKAEADRWGGSEGVPEPETDRFW
ncbi:hypothetical protein [Microbacterium hydrocarbonoxydans]|uniref:hypothetical protein n=1 Tax=Microbacterium hydrocarbonoxydans TaxID=273678 RepID=UPI00203E297C|nr:hypothetical protein [Microbacterium hydrocarbonoxydans]MCM3781079.1 hypothetical protein [Microbacterium hydrocarbonoxydans]